MSAQATAWTEQLQDTAMPNAESRAAWMQEVMTAICNAAMLRVKRTRRNAVYWWSPNLEKKRRECILA